jgi:Reverse transcriptase (RNA-dependent DNA polymerase)
MTISRPSFSGPPFRDCDSLGWHLRVRGAELLELADMADDFYFVAKEEPKSDGTVRTCYDARDPLKGVQKKILDRILRAVQFPRYLMGGLRDKDHPRDYVRNAILHSGKVSLIQEDIASFYPSISTRRVADIFQHVFRYPPAVAECLAKLCTRCGELVQGASTSTYLANLALWDREPLVEAKLRLMGLRYTRYIDDINVSCRRNLRADEREEIVNILHTMIRGCGYSPKRTKQRVASIDQPKIIHNLCVHGERPALPRAERNLIRAAVFQLEKKVSSAPHKEETWKMAQSVKSRLVIWRRLNEAQAEPLYARVNSVYVRLRDIREKRSR